MKKIFVNGRFLIQQITGVQRFAIELMKELSHTDIEFVILVPKGKPLITDLSEVTVKKVGPFNGLLWEQISLPIFLWKQSGKQLLLNLCNTAPLLYFNKVSSIMDMTTLINPSWFKWSFATYYKIILPLVAKSSKLIFTISENSKKDICDYLQISDTKIVNIGCGVSRLQAVNSTVKKDEKYIVAVSSIEPRKNFKRLILAMRKLSFKHKLYVIGSSGKVFNDPDLRNVLVDTENIEFTGYLSDTELASYYQSASLFVYPSLYEGFGLPPLEAMSLGCPVVTSNVSSLPEVCGDAAMYFDPYSVVDISQKIELLMDNDKLRKELTEKGFDQIKNFTWKKTSLLAFNKLEELI